MKKLFLLIMSGVFCAALTAQVNPDAKLKEEKLKEFLQRQKQVPVQQNKNLNINGTSALAKYSHSNSLGSVYILPKDRMPCLRPDSNAIVYNMPVHTMPKNFINIQKGKTPLAILPKTSTTTGQIPNAEAGNTIVFEAKP